EADCDHLAVVGSSLARVDGDGESLAVPADGGGDGAAAAEGRVEDAAGGEAAVFEHLHTGPITRADLAGRARTVISATEEGQHGLNRLVEYGLRSEENTLAAGAQTERGGSESFA